MSPVELLKILVRGAEIVAPFLLFGAVVLLVVLRRSKISEEFLEGTAEAFSVVLNFVAGESNQRPRVTPPPLAEFILLLLGPRDPDERRALAGDLQEFYCALLQEGNPWRARRLYWAEVLRSIIPLVWAKLRNLGVIAAVIEYGRRKIGW